MYEIAPQQNAIQKTTGDEKSNDRRYKGSHSQINEKREKVDARSRQSETAHYSRRTERGEDKTRDTSRKHLLQAFRKNQKQEAITQHARSIYVELQGRQKYWAKIKRAIMES